MVAQAGGAGRAPPRLGASGLAPEPRLHVARAWHTWRQPAQLEPLIWATRLDTALQRRLWGPGGQTRGCGLGAAAGPGPRDGVLTRRSPQMYAMKSSLESMDAMELDFRMRLAEVQRQYKEKQRELVKLQRRRDAE